MALSSGRGTFPVFLLIVTILAVGYFQLCQSFTAIPRSTRQATLLNIALPNFQPGSILRRSDYKQPANWISNVDLDFYFSSEAESSGTTRVTSQLTIVPNEHNELDSDDLILNGDSNLLQLVSISTIANGQQETRVLKAGTDYFLCPQNDTLVISSSRICRPSCQLQIVVETKHNQKELSGLYFRDGMYCTHCEPSGFQQITYFADRPDNCATFDKVRLEADLNTFPILLSNGNCQESGTAPEDPSRHYAIFQDPFPKPCYLFGLVVARNLESIRDSYTTRSGKTVDLVIYGEPNRISSLSFAIDTLKNAMKWDEDTFGLEYDLDTYRIVAAQHFNIGAMENKGLNIFMTSLIATDPTFTTDVTYDLVEKTIAHEYFHNWSGNRVTIRDWFEFTLKEGLTVYRDQEFTSYVGLKTSTRIDTVKILREKQFAEDASPARQAIRPESYASQQQQHSLDAIATSTTYHKGAEVFRMLRTILSKSGFRKGLNLYMTRHDGMGATCEDFMSAMADANPNVDLAQFSLWYSTAGTPVVSYDYNYKGKRLELSLSQRLGDMEDGPLLHIPVSIGLLDRETGNEVLPTAILHLKERTQNFTFDDLPGEVVPSLLRDFSAPVYLVPERNSESRQHIEQERLAFLAAYDTDGFNRWESLQELFGRYILTIYRGENDGTLESHVLTSFGRTLLDPNIDSSSKAAMLSLPSESILVRRLETRYDPVALLDARLQAMDTIAHFHKEALKRAYDELTPIVLSTLPRDLSAAKSRAIRALRNRCLEYLCHWTHTEDQLRAAELARTHFEQAICFTDQFVAFRLMSSMSGPNITSIRDDVSLQFYQLSQVPTVASSTKKNTILNKWFQTQALSNLSDALPRVQALTQHPDFEANNAGRFRSLITSFTKNTRSFHTEKGYQFIGNIIRQIDRRSPTLAVELAKKLTLFSNYEKPYSNWMQAELIKIQEDPTPKSNELLLTVSMALLQDGDFATSMGLPLDLIKSVGSPSQAANRGVPEPSTPSDRSKRKKSNKNKGKTAVSSTRGKKGFS
eukprot:scaffold265_cov131-Cylindrotheca_fusiformis.AAC.15